MIPLLRPTNCHPNQIFEQNLKPIHPITLRPQPPLEPDTARMVSRNDVSGNPVRRTAVILRRRHDVDGEIGGGFEGGMMDLCEDGRCGC